MMQRVLSAIGCSIIDGFIYAGADRVLTGPMLMCGLAFAGNALHGCIFS